MRTNQSLRWDILGERLRRANPERFAELLDRLAHAVEIEETLAGRPCLAALLFRARLNTAKRR